MKGTSKVVMGATLVMVVSLAIVLGLIVVLLAELYCSLLLRRRQFRLTTSNSTTTTTAATAATTTHTSPSQSSQPQDQPSPPPPPLSSLYAHGVLRAPRSYIFPPVSCKEEKVETKNQQQKHSKLHQVLEILESNTSPSTAFLQSPQQIQESPPQGPSTSACNGKASGNGEHFVYISNPIYDAGRLSETDTPFETPETSPSRLEIGSSSGEDEIARPSSSSSSSGPSSLPITPPLTPLKKLPAEACSVSLRDARSLRTSGSDSNSRNGISSSTSGSPCTSPSW